MDYKEIAEFAASVLSDKKAKDIQIIEIGTKASFADYFINATGNSERQVVTLADEIEDKMAEKGLLLKSAEGKHGSGWILLDFGDVIVNIFTKDMRDKYSLEKIWGDCNITTVEE